MKKFTANMVTANGEKQISVWLDNETSNILEAINDSEFIQQYIIEEYKAQLLEQKETRRHTSLENSLYVIDENADLDWINEKRELYKALETLTDKQREVFISHVLDRKSFRQIGDETGLHKQTVTDSYNAAIKKIKKIFRIAPVQNAVFVAL